MRKVLIIALGLASLGALADVQPASADWIKKRVCNTNYTTTPRQFEKCYTVDAKKYNCSVELVNFLGLRECFDDYVLVPNNWKGASANGFNKTFNPSTNLKNR
jgi:hypothetical protein